ncbi:MAG: DUF2155 domain-containing protein [Pseudomonadota bacterium]
MIRRVCLSACVAAALAVPAVATGQQQLVTPQGDGGTPQTIEDLLGTLDSAPAPAPWQETEARVRPQPDQSRSFAVLSALDKITATVSPLAVGVGETATFGTLTITVRACQTTGADSNAQNAVFLEVIDEPPGDEAGDSFSGWMFSAARSISAMEHPVYDLWLVGCVDEVPQPPEDMAREAVFGLPGNPPLPPALPSRRL